MEVAILDAIAEDDLSSKPTLNVPISLHPILAYMIFSFPEPISFEKRKSQKSKPSNIS